MKKETINSFTDGLVTDLNELNTPEKVLTDALNATLITYNGNEFTLQNDLGNTKVGTARLPQGYVPVGMKEHGGIIYVASHNPATGYSQIGCFPSPQQLYGNDDEAEFTKININLNNHLEYINNNYTQIKQDFCRYKLFDENNKIREFHPGDKFIITANLNPIKSFLESKILKLRLASVGKDGVVNYINDSDLKIYDNGTWIYEPPKNEDTEDLLSDLSKIQVFPGKTSGQLMLIVEYKVFDSFDLSWTYEKTNNRINAVFTGQANGNAIGNNESDKENASLETGTKIYNLSNGEINTEVNITPVNDEINYTLAPYSYWGINKNLIRTGTINVANLTTSGELDQWSYYVGSDYVDITWAFSYIPESTSNEIVKMRFIFIPINVDPKENENYEDENCKIVEISKQSFNGNFDEHITFDDNFQKNKVYVCKIDTQTFNSTDWNNIGYEYIYTSTFFNGVSAQQISEWKNKRPVIEVDVSIDPQLNQKTLSTNYLISKEFTKNTLDSGESSNVLNSLIVTNPKDNTKYYFNAGIERTEEYLINPKAVINQFTYNGKNYGNSHFTGDFDIPIRRYVINSNSVEEKLEYSENDTNLKKLLDSSKIKDSIKLDEENKNKLTVKLYRQIVANNGNIVSSTIEREKLCPIYEDGKDHSHLFGFKYKNGNTLQCVGLSDNYITYNAQINNTSTSTTENSAIGIKDSKVSSDTSLNLALSKMNTSDRAYTIGLVAGVGGDQASMYFIKPDAYPKLGYNDNDKIAFRKSGYKWSTHDYEIDEHDNYIIAAWRDDTGKYSLVNLASRKNEETSKEITISLRGTTIKLNNRKRVDTMLKCILSQLLIVQNATESIKYTAPNNSKFIYHLPYKTVGTFTSQVENEDINYKLFEGCKDKWDNYATNYLPKFKVADKTIKTNIEFGKDLQIDSSLLDLYLNSYNMATFEILPHNDLATVSDDDEWKNTWKNYIYLGKVKSISSNGICRIDTDDNGNYLLATKNVGTHGRVQKYLYNWTNTLNDTSIGDNNPDLLLSELDEYDFNKVFKTTVKLDNLTDSKLPYGYINEIVINSGYANLKPAIAIMVADANQKGVKLLRGVEFGEKSIYE